MGEVPTSHDLLVGKRVVVTAAAGAASVAVAAAAGVAAAASVPTVVFSATCSAPPLS